VIQAKPETLAEYVDAGCLIQVTAGSITGRFGSAAKRAAEHLMRQGWCHVIASDAHSARGRPPALAEAVEVATALIGEEAAQSAVRATPSDIIAGRPVRLVPVAPPQRQAGLTGAVRRLFSRS
jgi:protein-tyrosine phosphatase